MFFFKKKKLQLDQDGKEADEDGPPPPIALAHDTIRQQATFSTDR